MFKLDNAFLEELGLGALPPAEKNKMLAHIYETLEMRVGMRLAEQMTNEQLDEFESYINRQDESGALKWLETNFPNYKQVVAEELEKLKAEIKQVAPQIVAQAAQVPQPQSPQQPVQNGVPPEQPQVQPPSYAAQQPSIAQDPTNSYPYPPQQTQQQPPVNPPQQPTQPPQEPWQPQ